MQLLSSMLFIFFWFFSLLISNLSQVFVAKLISCQSVPLFVWPAESQDEMTRWSLTTWGTVTADISKHEDMRPQQLLIRWGSFRSSSWESGQLRPSAIRQSRRSQELQRSLELSGSELAMSPGHSRISYPDGLHEEYKNRMIQDC